VNLLKKPKFRAYLKRLLGIALPIFSTLFIVGTTALIIALISGYSFDISKREVIKTGVLNVETSPTDADISVTGTYYGKSNRAIPNLKVGTYTIKIYKDGYFPFTKQVEILHGLASPVIVPLLRIDGQKEIIDLTTATAVDYNSTGYYVLEIASAKTTVEATSTISPTPTKAPAKNSSTLTYTLTKISMTKPLFDDPHPVLNEKMTITALSATPITSILVSPTGKMLLITTTDKNKIKSISVVPFKRDSTINANLTDSKALTNYAKASGVAISWSKNGDYLILDTPEQIISYNVKSGARGILAEKPELVTKGDALTWNTTDNGIVYIRRAAGTRANSFEVMDISYNGNPLTTQLPLIELDSPPTKIWSYSTTDTPLFAIATKKGSYLVGLLYTQKSGELQITQADISVADIDIDHFGEDFSKILLSSEELISTPLLIPEKHTISFTEQKGTILTLFTYNKHIADKSTKLGKTTLIEGDNTLLTPPESLIAGAYVTTLNGESLLAVDTAGDNLITLQSDIKTYTYGQNDTALLFTNADNHLFFRVLR